MTKQKIAMEGRAGGRCVLTEFKNGEIHIRVEDSVGHHATVDVSGYGFTAILKKHVGELKQIRYSEGL